METLSLPQTPSAHLHSSTEFFLHRRVRFPSWRHHLVPASLSRGSARPSFGLSFSLVHSGNNLKDSSETIRRVTLFPDKENYLKEAIWEKRTVTSTCIGLNAHPFFGCMNEVYDALAERILPVSAAASNLNAKYIVGLAGPPGAGKSTVASEVVKQVNKLWPHKASSFDSEVQPPDVAIVVPMDGFHLYRSQLDAMENPEEAHARRGAPWTFDPVLLLKCLQNLRNQGSVYAPSFDHGVGDPVEDDIFVSLQHKVVIVEGNYLLLEEGTWKNVSDIFDEKWFIDVDLDISMQRVLKRHISTGKPPDVAKWRIECNDRPNAELIMNSKKNADIVIRSIDL